MRLPCGHLAAADDGMVTSAWISRVTLAVLAGVVLLVVLVWSSGRGGDDGETRTTTTAAARPTEDLDGASDGGDPLGDGSLGIVTVEQGAEIQIRSLNVISGEVSFLGVPNQRSVAQAIVDYGRIRGFSISMGVGLDELCSADGGQAAAEAIVADEQVIGVIGTSCSGAAAAASPLISEAGMVMISGSNTSPALTSDQQGNAAAYYNVGYYRTAHNDVFQGLAMADYAFNVLGITSAAAIHDGDPYTFGLSDAFGKSFTELGGEFTTIEAIAKGDTDLVPVLTSVAAGSPEAVFAPLFHPESDFLFEQVRTVSGLEDATLLSTDASLTTTFLTLEQSRGIHYSVPDTRFGSNVNESTGKSAAEVLADYEANNGEAPSAPFWGHSYDATAMLLDAIEAASWVEDGRLMIDRDGVRDFLNGISGYEGISGTIDCDNFGDCGSQRITVVHHLDENDLEASYANVVFEYAPQ